MENIFWNGWDLFCEGGECTAANLRLYAVTYDHISHKYELHNAKNNRNSRPELEAKSCKISKFSPYFMIMNMILTRDEPGLIWLRYWPWPGRSCRRVGSCSRLAGPGWAGLLSSYSGCRCGAGAWSRARHITQCSVPAHCLTQFSVSQCHSPRVTSNDRGWTRKYDQQCNCEHGLDKLMLYAVTIIS